MNQKPFSVFVSQNKTAFSSLGFAVVLFLIFIIGKPAVFLNSSIYMAVFVMMPAYIFLSLSLVFVVTSGEIDLSFPSVIGLSAWIFALASTNGVNLFVCFLLALLVGAAAGALNGFLVTKLKLSALVTTLGMNFLYRGLINIGVQGHGIDLTGTDKTLFGRIFTGRIGDNFPAQMLWAVIFSVIAWVLFNRHSFGAQIKCIGDNKDSSREMGINVDRVKTMSFIFVGIASALAGVLVNLVSISFYPTTGDGFMLFVLAAVFVGGTPTWGGVGTITGAFIGAAVISFLETGIISLGLTGFYTQFFYGLIIILSLISHRFNKGKNRY